MAFRQEEVFWQDGLKTINGITLSVFLLHKGKSMNSPTEKIEMYFSKARM